MTSPTKPRDMAPERIYLQIEDDEFRIPILETTWCQDKINESDIEYVRADLLSAAQAEIEALRNSGRKEAEFYRLRSLELEAEMRNLRAKLAKVDEIARRTYITRTDIAEIRRLIAEVK